MNNNKKRTTADIHEPKETFKHAFCWTHLTVPALLYIQHSIPNTADFSI
jgi:hypothetical protein